MKLSIQILCAFVITLGCASAQEASVSNEILQSLDASSIKDSDFNSFIDWIRNSAKAIDEAFGAGGPHRTSSQRACDALKRALPDAYTDNSTNPTTYDQLRRNNWSTNCDLPAACFVTPTEGSQVAVALKIVNRAKSKFAVRSGGHNPNPGFAGIGAEGVTIDTQKLTALSLSADKSTVTVGGGQRWGAVQKFLDPQGVAAVSGRNNEPGVSGLLLGGGHPIINSFTGLAVDNIKNAEVALSDGRVVKASPVENSDLFKALKGGVNNLGIVTKWELKTAQPRNVWYRNVVYSNADPRGILDAFAQVQQKMESDDKAGIAMTISPAGFAVTFVYGQYTANPTVFDAFARFTPVQERTPPTNGTTASFIDAQGLPPLEATRDTAGATTVPDTQLYVDIYNAYTRLASANAGAGTAYLLPMQTFGSAAARIAHQNGGNILGNSARAQTWWNPIAQYTNPAEEQKVHGVLLELANTIKSEAAKRNLGDRYILANIGGRGQDVLASYGEENVAFLRQVSQKYDPSRLFQKLQNGGFLVGA